LGSKIMETKRTIVVWLMLLALIIYAMVSRLVH
jgi:hypothetical protein